MQTSFIPKKPVTDSHISGSGISLFLLLSIIVFIVVLILAFGVWLWQKSLVSQIEKQQKALNEAKKTYEENTIEELIRLDNRIEEAKGLLNRHLTVSPVFVFLEKNILRNVSLKSLKFSYSGSDKIKIDLSGTALSYEVLSKQSDVFGREDLETFISEPIISNFSPTGDGRVDFTFSASVSPNLVTYNKTIPTNNVDVPTNDDNISSSTSTPQI